MEKGDNTLEYLIATPLRTWEYLVSKMISLTVLAVLAGTIIALFSRGKAVNYYLLLGGIVLTSFLFILIGFVAVAKFRTVNEYVMTSVLYMMVLPLPLLDFFGILQSPLFYLFPTQASLLLLRRFVHRIN
ncbi:fluoroquinolone export ABC transporter permease subunit [Geosporobacter subterraneus]